MKDQDNESIALEGHKYDQCFKSLAGKKNGDYVDINISNISDYFSPEVVAKRVRDTINGWFGHNPTFKIRFSIMLQCYFDESGTHGMDTIILAGYIAPAEIWSEFSLQWQCVLQSFGLQYFHMKDFYNIEHGIFRGISMSEREQILDKLIAIARENVPYGLILSLDPKVYGQIVAGEPRYRTVWGTAYTALVQECITEIRLWVHEKKFPLEPISYMFEEGHANASQAIRLLQWIANTGDLKDRFLLGSYGLGGKADYPPLQMADILAHQSYASQVQSLETMSLTTKMTPNLQKLMAAPTTLKHLHRHYRKEDIKENFDSLRPFTRKGKGGFRKKQSSDG